MNYEFDVALRIRMTKETLKSHLTDNASHCLDKLTACDTTRGRWMPSTLQMISHALCIGSPRPVNYEMAAIFDMPLVERQLRTEITMTCIRLAQAIRAASPCDLTKRFLGACKRSQCNEFCSARLALVRHHVKTPSRIRRFIRGWPPPNHTIVRHTIAINPCWAQLRAEGCDQKLNADALPNCLGTWPVNSPLLGFSSAIRISASYWSLFNLNHRQVFLCATRLRSDKLSLWIAVEGTETTAQGKILDLAETLRHWHARRREESVKKARLHMIHKFLSRRIPPRLFYVSETHRTPPGMNMEDGDAVAGATFRLSYESAGILCAGLLSFLEAHYCSLTFDVAQLVDRRPGEGLEFLGPESAATMVAMATHQCFDFSNVIICAPIRCAFWTLRLAESDPVSGERERERAEWWCQLPKFCKVRYCSSFRYHRIPIRQPTRVWQQPYFGHGMYRIFVSTALRGRKLATEVLSYHHLQTVHRRLPIKSTFCQPPFKQGQEFPFHGIKLWKLATGAYIRMQKPKRPAAAASTMSSRHTFDRHLQGFNGEPVAQVMCHSYSFCLVTLFAIDTERLGVILKVEDEERNEPTGRRKVIFGRGRTH
ncbi:uncharacterized protein CLUP02_05625 [Colletotrichum lupini]|uniref:Uncharacterized protein n=1 Tax=Colletotrichum lupini TaxID=145971 RepID=A0A9Q8SMV0_9PEZI|nr:uncharacterized protein CLUP02_05625 [Colletotrichum lupini]UQC80143.1 hypothetical protein CLUP02_05625 [Colletotrichum lupini]